MTPGRSLLNARKKVDGSSQCSAPRSTTCMNCETSSAVRFGTEDAFLHHGNCDCARASCRRGDDQAALDGAQRLVRRRRDGDCGKRSVRGQVLDPEECTRVASRLYHPLSEPGGSRRCRSPAWY